jgi:putative glutamine amidotransferase
VTGSTRPLIGITAYEEQARWNQWDLRAAVLPVRYVRSVEAGGGTPLLIPVQHLERADALAVLGRIDGLILSGGPDVNPARYGAEASPSGQVPRDSRDAFELALIEAAGEAGDMPTLAICRGLQLLNVARGGTLVQHLPDKVGHEGHAPLPNDHGHHEGGLAPATLLASALGWESGTGSVPTAHHQAIDVVGKDLEASAWAEDGTVEAVEDRCLPFFVGVQWHPEAGEDMSLFRALVAAASGAS